jgi:adenylate cyclase
VKLTGKFNRVHLAGAIGALLAVGCGLLFHEFRLGSGLVNSSYDLLHVWRGDRRVTEAVVVYLDEVSCDKLGQPQGSAWDRSIHAKLIERLAVAGARAIAFDVVFSRPDPINPAGDETMAKAMKQSGRVILAADTVAVGPTDTQSFPPFPLLADNAAVLGSDEVAADADLMIRQHLIRKDRPLSSLSWATAVSVEAEATRQEGSEDLPRWMNYYGSPNFVPWKSYYEALDPALVPDSFFHDKVVFVGGRFQTKFANERKDEYVNPFSAWLPEAVKARRQAMFMAGVEVQATAFLNLLRGDWLTRPTSATERLLIIGLGLLFGYGLIQLRPVWATGVALGGLALAVVACYGLFVHKLIWFPWAIVAVQIGIALSWSILFNSIQLYVEKRLYEQTLRIYLPPKLVKKFAKSRHFLRPGAETQTLTLLFSDIANFTSMSEGMNSNDLAALMNAYFQVAVAKCIHKADGTVAKFIGDAIFAFWNAPDEQANHALLACQAALYFREQATQPIHGKLLPTRIGLHTGKADVGNFGSDERVDYTALGENVNLASRMEGLNKHLGTQCLISGETRAGVGDKLVTRALGKFQLKGFEGLVDVHELVGWPDQAEATRAWREAFAEALTNYEQRNLEFAEIGFRRVLELRPDDGPSNFYLARIADLATQVLPDNWVTHTILKEK